MTKEKLEPGCALCNTSLIWAISVYTKKFGMTDNYVYVKVSIEGIFDALLIDKSTICNACGVKNIFFSCDRNLQPDEWEISDLTSGNIFHNDGA